MHPPFSEMGNVVFQLSFYDFRKIYLLSGVANVANVFYCTSSVHVSQEGYKVENKLPNPEHVQLCILIMILCSLSHAVLINKNLPCVREAVDLQFLRQKINPRSTESF